MVAEALATKALFEGEGWRYVAHRPALKTPKNSLHFVALLSDGNVHSHIDHLIALVAQAKVEGIKSVKIHAILDGRDVPPTSGLVYAEKLESFLSSVRSPDFSVEVASGGGRMQITMDRYNADWGMVERGYLAHVCGQAAYQFKSLTEAIAKLREQGFHSDQDLPGFVLVGEDRKPVGTIHDGDSVVLCNFRGDRAIQFSRALTETDFREFKRPFFPQIHYAGMMQYDGDLKIPAHFLVCPPVISNTMTELLSATGVRQFACSETQKFGHVTYFWNGNRSGKFNDSLEKEVEIESDRISFELRPWMKCAEVCDTTIAAMRNNTFQVGRINFANGDMVGHTGDFAAAIVAVGVVDLCLGRLMKAAQETGTVLVVTADHGNADEMFEKDKKSMKVVFDSNGIPKQKTSHTLAPVPFAIFNADNLGLSFSLRSDLPQAGLANVAATVLELSGFTPPDFYEPSLLRWDENSGELKKKVP